MMAAIDTNVLVRFIVQDDPSQVAATHRLIDEGVRSGEPLFVSATVVLETEWVLRSRFKYSKAKVIASLAELFSSGKVSQECASAFEESLFLYQASSADFADCLHAAIASDAGETPMWTFDIAASRLPGARAMTMFCQPA